MIKFGGPVPLESTYDFAGFSCDKEPLDNFLRTYALQNQANGSSKTYVGLAGNRVIAYYSLAVGSVLFDDAPERMAKGLARDPIPILLMARFAVDLQYQGRGVGRGLFKDALKRCLGVARQVGVRAFMVHAKDDEAKAMYENFGMQVSPSNERHLYFLIKEVEKLIL